MSFVVLISLVSALVAGCAAGLHGWLFVLRPRDRSNLWLTITAAGIAGMSLFTAQLHQSQDIATSIRMQQLTLLASGPVLFGLYRYSFAYLGIAPRFARHVVGAVSGSLMLCGLLPDIFLSGVPTRMEIHLLGAHWVQSELTLAGKVFVALVSPIPLYLVLLYWRFVPRSNPNRTTLMVMLTLWSFTFLNDILAACKVYEAPMLLPLGYSAFLMGLSSIQIRELVDSMVEVERSAEHLSELVDRRTVEVRQTELQLAHGAQMATIGALAASLAHEINNPIAYVSSTLNRLEESWAVPDEQGEIGEMLVECQDGIERVRTIVSSLLELARRSDGADQPVDLHALIEPALAVVQREAHLRARLETDLDPIPKVSGDPRLLGHVVLSLLMNAVRSIPEGAPDENRIRIETFAGQDCAFLRVIDSAECRADVAPIQPQRSVLGDARDTDPDELGLAIVRQILERHQGQISLEEGPGGRTSTIRLPALQPDSSHHEDASQGHEESAESQ